MLLPPSAIHTRLERGREGFGAGMTRGAFTSVHYMGGGIDLNLSVEQVLELHGCG